MMKAISFSIIFVIGILFNSNAYTIEKAERITDREIIEVLTELKTGQKALQKQIDDLKTFMLWGFGILFGGMGVLIGFVLWDRRTALAPAIKKSDALEERELKLEERVRLIEEALREFAKEEPRLATILKSLNLL